MDSIGNWWNTLMSGFSTANDIGRKQSERFAPRAEELAKSRQSGEAQSPFSADSFANAAANTMADWDYQNQAFNENWGDVFAAHDAGKQKASESRSRYQDMINNQELYPTLGEDALLYGSPEEMSALSFLSPQSSQEPEQTEKEASLEPSKTAGINQGPTALMDAWNSPDAWNPGYGPGSEYAQRLLSEGMTDDGTVDMSSINMSDVDSIKRPRKSERNLGSQMDEWYDFLENTELGQQIASEHPEYTRDNLGYSALRASQDADTYALWAANDPRFARRLLSANIDANDTDTLADSIYDYMWGNNAINAYDYFTNPDAVYNLANDTSTMSELAQYFNTLDGYDFASGFSQQWGLDRGDLAAQMLARQMNQLGPGLLDKDDVSDFLIREGYLNPNERFSFTSRDSDLYKNSSAGSENARKYGSAFLDEYNPSAPGIYDDYVVDTILESLNRPYTDLNLGVASSRTPSAKRKSVDELAEDVESYV